MNPRALFLIVASLILPLNSWAETEFHVAPGGADSNDGSQGKPFATLERARDAVRGLKKNGLPAGGVTVWIEPGVHLREKTFELSAEDSGDTKFPVVWRGRSGAVLHAGRIIPASSFKSVADPKTASRLDPEAAGKIVQLDLAALRIEHTGPFPVIFNNGGGILEIYVNDSRLPLSRWPDDGYTTMLKVIDRGELTRGGERGGTFVTREKRPLRWRTDEGVWIEGFWRVPWDIETVRVKSIDPANGQITLAAPVNGGIGSKHAGPEGSGGEPWRAINLIEEIDRPGEWCIDFKTRTLYLWPPDGFARAQIFIADLAAPVVALKNTVQITIRDLAIEGGLGDGVRVSGGSENRIAGCSLRNLGGNGAVLSGGTHNGVRSCDFTALGASGIEITGGDRATLTPCGNFAENNHIHHCAVRKKLYAPGIMVGRSGNQFGTGDAVGVRVAHNLIHDQPHAGILYGGNENVFEFNEIHHVVLESDDMGAFYTTYDWTSRGNLVRWNFLHDSPHANGVYLDDGDSGDTVTGNIALRMDHGFFISGGHDNIFRHNIAIDCPRGLHIDARGVSRGYNAQNKKLTGDLISANYRQPPWSTRYPALAKILEFHPELPTGSLFEENVCVDCKTPEHVSGKKEEFAFSTIRGNIALSLADAGFADAARSDFRLKKESSIFRLIPHFEPIPFEKIGLEHDGYRATVPSRHEMATTDSVVPQ